jgi:hypothetical protein
MQEIPHYEEAEVSCLVVFVAHLPATGFGHDPIDRQRRI